jgi:hypothetical protein
MIELATFATAGNATFTVKSTRTGNRFTYKVRKPNQDGPAFVALLSGPNNESDFRFLGTIFPDGNYRHGRKSTVSPTAPSAVAFAWVWQHASNLPASVEVHHEGRCCRCGRKLTVPESIESGIGPECASIMGM